MGQKVSPIGFRLGVNKGWSSSWYANKKDFAKNVLEDNKIRTFLKKKYYTSAISSIEIERTATKLTVTINTGRPGMLIGTKGLGVDGIRKELAKIAGAKTLIVNIKEVKKPDLDATLVAESITAQLEKRVAFKRALKQGLQRVMKSGAKGCKVQVSGVVDGANSIHRTEKYKEGSLPLHTIRANIDYGTAAAYTNYGKLGVKVWIYKGEILGKSKIDKNKGGVN